MAREVEGLISRCFLKPVDKAFLLILTPCLVLLFVCPFFFFFFSHYIYGVRKDANYRVFASFSSIEKSGAYSLKEL